MQLWDVKAAVLRPFRRGPREVAWTPGFMGLGNLLSLLTWADDRQARGLDSWVLVTPKLRPWLTVFPGLASLTLERDEVRFADRRVMPWSAAVRARPDSGNPPAAPIVPEDLERFISKYLAAAPELHRRDDAASNLVINVRRGDYYSVPEIRGQFSFDQVEYLREAMSATLARGELKRIEVVSDGIEWCKARLGWLEDVAPTIFRPHGDPVQDFFAVATSRRIILTNSTFSYWAGYVSTVLYGDNHADVVAPRFFDRTQNGGRAWLLDPRWTVVEEIAGGWDS